MKQWIRTGAIFATSVLIALAAYGQQGAQDGQWPTYSGDLGSTKYAPLDQINADNIANLEVVWEWNSPDNDTRQGSARSNKVTPIYVDGTLYTTSMYGIVSAIDATTGETKWTYDSKMSMERRPGNLGYNARGLSYWSDGNGDDRIIFATQKNYMYALDTETGKLIPEFGKKGIVDLNEPYRREVNRSAVWAISPPLVVGDIIVVGRAINDGPTRKSMPPGDVFAFDAKTGAHAWTFYNPPLPGTLGADTWEDGSIEYSGNANVWTHMSADEELGLVYLPFGTPTNDWYGGHRHGDNVFAESIVAVKAKTGEYVWHFQHVHHGMWDYDIPTAPALVDIEVDGKAIKALAQVTKQGFLWVLDRESGEPVWSIEERPVPQTTAKGEKSSPTQPFPTKPAPFLDQGSTEDILIDYTPELKEEAKKILAEYNHGPLYTPAVEDKYTIYNPGWGGGGNWNGCAVDPDTGMIYIPAINCAPIAVMLNAPDPARSDFNFVGRQAAPPAGPQGLPLFRGPYSRVTAIDLNTGDHAWLKPLGDGPIDHPALKDLNLGPIGGFSRGFPLLTKTLLIIVSGGEYNLRAFDKVTGELVYRTELPGRVSAAPITYIHEDKQYIAMAIVAQGDKPESRIITLALP